MILLRHNITSFTSISSIREQGCSGGAIQVNDFEIKDQEYHHEVLSSTVRLCFSRKNESF